MEQASKKPNSQIGNLWETGIAYPLFCYPGHLYSRFSNHDIPFQICTRQEGRGTYNDSLDQPTKTVSKQQTRLKERLDWLQKLVEDDYRRHPMNACSDPVDAIRHQMIKKGMKQKDLVSMLGGKNRVCEVLARHRQLKLPMIRKLIQNWIYRLSY